MKSLKRISSLIVMLVLMASFSQCSTAQKLQKKAPIEFGQTYAQKWVAGVKGAGSGINVFIPIEDNSVSLDSMFFRGQKVKLEFIKANQALYVGRFSTDFNQKQDIILSSDMNEESKNKLPKPKVDMPFEFNDDECVITYRKGDQTLYYKISNIKIEQPVHYPSAPNGQ
ncbi:hypothetical protein [Psychroserpens jangbogonensis]|uniref:hypothetical protein n=1 Tax=Psychroserpens jangbogonensis TaxID=1484460 RepID=UPI00053F10C7|nr:hypothetical protein [Psychroserpens jangbogonensis]